VQGKTHLLPRTLKGLVMLLWILICFIMVEWPILSWANRIEPFIGGFPFIYFWLTFWYVMIAIGAIVTALFVWRP